MQRILVVEHDRHVGLTLLDGLRSLPDCEVAIATNGDDALELFEQRTFDLLITDYKMPGTNGLALASRVQELHPQTAVLMITAHRDELLSSGQTGGARENPLGGVGGAGAVEVDGRSSDPGSLGAEHPTGGGGIQR